MDDHSADNPFRLTEPHEKLSDVLMLVRESIAQLRTAEAELRALRLTEPQRINGAFSGIVKTCGALELDTGRAVCIWKGNIVPLTKKEMLMLDTLLTPAGRVMTRDRLLDILEYDLDAEMRSIDSLMKRMRSRFRKVDPTFRQIRTVYGIGYKWALDDAELPY